MQGSHHGCVISDDKIPQASNLSVVYKKNIFFLSSKPHYRVEFFLYRKEPISLHSGNGEQIMSSQPVSYFVPHWLTALCENPY